MTDEANSRSAKSVEIGRPKAEIGEKSEGRKPNVIPCRMALKAVEYTALQTLREDGNPRSKIRTRKGTALSGWVVLKQGKGLVMRTICQPVGLRRITERTAVRPALRLIERATGRSVVRSAGSSSCN